jgi:hypothetical protein
LTKTLSDIITLITRLKLFIPNLLREFSVLITSADDFIWSDLVETLIYSWIKRKSICRTSTNYFFYKNRLQNKIDYIASNQWKKADMCAKFLTAINKTKQSKLVGLFSFLKVSFQAPRLFFYFYREFGVNFLKEKITYFV